MSLRTWSVAVVLVGGVACSAPPAPERAGEAQPLAARGESEHAHGDEHAHEHGNEYVHGNEHVHGSEHEHVQKAPGLTRIADAGHICMLSNRFLGEKQHVPVDVEGKTYFGCCANCAARLGQMEKARVAEDPITGRSIDKASAVLARDETNKVLYFESEETFAQMQKARAAQ